MTTTRRLSSLQGGSAHQQTSLLLESYETFKRKHIQQNREIINKNSELNKEKADLQSQISLMRVERLSLMGSNLKLNIQLESMRKKLERAHQRHQDLVDERDRLKRSAAQHHHQGSVDRDQVEAMRHALVSAIAALQAFGLALPPPPPASSSSSYSTTGKASSVAPGSPPSSPFTASFDSPDQSSTPGATTPSSSATAAAAGTSRRSSLAERGPRQSMCTLPPDLSNISEADASDEEREEQRVQEHHEAEMFRETARQQPAWKQLSAARSHSPSPPPPPASPPPVRIQIQTATATATPLTRPTSKGPRAPPKAPSASSHSTLGNASTSKKRPARRVSGMLRPSLAVEFGESDGGVEEGDEPATDVVAATAAAFSSAEVTSPNSGAGTLLEPTETRGDSADEEGQGEEGEEYAPPAMATATSSRSRRRVSSVGLDTATHPSLAVRTTRVSRSSRSTSPAPAEPASVAARPVLAEIQPPTSTPTPTATAKEKIVERMRRRTTRAPVPVVPAADEDADGASASNQRGTAPAPAPAPAPSPATALANSSNAKATACGSAAADREAEVEVAPAVSISASSSKDEDAITDAHEGAEEEEVPAGGRRARKSVNYALPKLNTKMRRPEDYVPVKPGASKPRKSTKPSTAAPRTSELLPVPLSAAAPVPTAAAGTAPPEPHYPISAAVPIPPLPAVPRTASLAGKKPPPPPPPPPSDSLSAGGDSWNEEQFLRRSSSQSRPPRASAGGRPASSLGGQDLDLDARRRQRQAERDQLARLSATGGPDSSSSAALSGAVGRRHEIIGA
ncbi:hypothetical protein JCM3774_000919 [Rhodotorula dairenensis]